jgi:hypothetical protein
MKKQWSIGAAAVLLLVGVVAFCGYRRAGEASNASRSELLQLIPSDSSAVLFADLGELRRAPFFAALFAWAPRPQADPDYSEFLNVTGFDYERDLTRVAITMNKRGDESTLFAVADGQFDRHKIAAYASKSGAVENRSGREIFFVPAAGRARKISFTFLGKDRIALADDAYLNTFLDAAQRKADTVEWRARFERLAGSPLFAVIRQDAATGTALAAQAPGGLHSPQLSALLDQLLWITLAGKPENDRLRIVTEGECMAEETARQLADLLNGIVVLAQTGLNEPKTRQQLDPATREAYLELLKSAEVSKIDRADTKSVRLVFDLTPKFLEAAHSVAPALPVAPASNGKPGRKAPGT